MIILFRPDAVLGNPIFSPIVIVDYTRSDEQWSDKDINKYINQLGTGLGGPVSISNKKVYSLDYAMIYSHIGISYGDSLKTSFTATIKNAPIELVTLLNIQQFTSQQNLQALKKTINAVIDPQVKFPQGGFVIKSAPDVNGISKIITRKFIIYSSPSEYDTKTRTSTLILKGAAFDAMVMRLQFALNIDDKKPLMDQLRSAFRKKQLSIIPSSTRPADIKSLNSRLPVVSKYYSPAPVYDIMNELCRDNNLAYYEQDGIYYMRPLGPDETPSQETLQNFSFQNYVNGSNVMVGFKPDNYTSATFEGEVYDARLFTSVAVYDDSLSVGVDSTGQITPGLFATYTKIPGADVKIGSNTISGYRFYVQNYTYFDSRDKTSITITGTNNWLISVMKIDNILENAIYKNQLGKS